jgi:hypothetical protein
MVPSLAKVWAQRIVFRYVAEIREEKLIRVIARVAATQAILDEEASTPSWFWDPDTGVHDSVRLPAVVGQQRSSDTLHYS